MKKLAQHWLFILKIWVPSTLNKQRVFTVNELPLTIIENDLYLLRKSDKLINLV